MDLVGGMWALSLVLGGLWAAYWLFVVALAFQDVPFRDFYPTLSVAGWVLLTLAAILVPAAILAPLFLQHFVVCAFFPRKRRAGRCMKAGDDKREALSPPALHP